MADNEAMPDVDSYEWRYTREVLERMYNDFAKEAKEGNTNDEDGRLAIAAGHALDFMNIARNIPENPQELNLIGPSVPNDMAKVAAFAAMILQNEGPDAVRTKLAKMLSSYEFFTTMNTLTAFEVDFEYRIDESGIILSAKTLDGESLEVNLLARARFAMARSFFPEIGEEPNIALVLGPLYNKLHGAFVVPLIAPERANER